MAKEEKNVPNFLTFNTQGLQPTSVEYRLTVDQLADMILEIAKSEIGFIKEVTHLVTERGDVYWMLWFPAKCDHFVDRSTNDTVLRTSLPTLSAQFNEFVKKFGYVEADDKPDGSRKVNIGRIMGKNEERGYHDDVRYLRVSINPFLQTIFDSYGREYRAKYGEKAPDVMLKRTWEFKQGQSKKKILMGITVNKILFNAAHVGNGTRPRPKGAAKF